MASLTGYPMCCGAQVVQNFSGDSEANRNLLIELIAKMDQGENVSYGGTGKAANRLVTVILNDTQCNNSPKTLQTLADLGFVYVARQNNGVHDSWINLFVRCRMDQAKAPTGLKPKFSYPGLDVSGWGYEHHKSVPFKKVPKKGVSPIKDPFKRIDPYNKDPDYTYVLDKPQETDIDLTPEVEICNPFAAIAA